MRCYYLVFATSNWQSVAVEMSASAFRAKLVRLKCLELNSDKSGETCAEEKGFYMASVGRTADTQRGERGTAGLSHRTDPANDR